MRIFRMIGKALRAVFRPVEANAVTFVALYLLGVVCAWLTVPNTPSGKLYENLYLELFLDLYLLCVVFWGFKLFFRSVLKASPWADRLAKGFKFLVCVVLYGVALADVYCFEKYGSSLTPSMLMLVGETDSREAGEFLSSVLQWETLTGGVGWLLLIALGHGIASRLSSLTPSRPTPLPLPVREGSGMSFWLRTPRLASPPLREGLGVGLLCLLVWSATASWKNKEGLWRLMTLPTIGAVENEVTRYHRANQYLPIYRLIFSLRANQLASQQVDQLIQAAKGVKVDSCDYTSPTIVLIIGESYNKHHSQLYGYYMPTTPRQVARERTGQLLKFTDVVTPYNLTSFVFKHMFSTYVIGQEGSWSDYPLFPKVFKEAGYEVTFLTNQFVTKAGEAVFDFSGGFFLNDPTLSAAMFDHRNEKTHIWDDGLLKEWDELSRPTPLPLPVREGSDYSIGNEKQAEGHSTPLPHREGQGGGSAGSPSLVIFHLLGQHMNYYSRYPKKQTHFTAEDYQKHRPKMLPHRKRQLVWYDNAVLYNDSIVDQIVRRFEQQDAVVIYVPDHGEEIFEPGRYVICRSHSDDIDYPLAYYEYEVPFWVWCSKKYIAARPELFRQIRDARKRPLMTDALPHMLMYLAGIHSKDYHPEFNILSPEYNEKRPRLMKDRVDYDTLTHDMTSMRTANAPKKRD